MAITDIAIISSSCRKNTLSIKNAIRALSKYKIRILVRTDSSGKPCSESDEAAIAAARECGEKLICMCERKSKFESSNDVTAFLERDNRIIGVADYVLLFPSEEQYSGNPLVFTGKRPGFSKKTYVVVPERKDNIEFFMRMLK